MISYDCKLPNDVDNFTNIVYSVNDNFRHFCIQCLVGSIKHCESLKAMFLKQYAKWNNFGLAKPVVISHRAVFLFYLQLLNILNTPDCFGFMCWLKGTLKLQLGHPWKHKMCRALFEIYCYTIFPFPASSIA